MGIYDRDYVRDNRGSSMYGPRGGGMSINARKFSITTWIIIINVVIFVVDQLLGAGGFAVRIDVGTVWSRGVGPTVPHEVIMNTTVPDPGGSGFSGYPIVDAQTRDVIGVKRFADFRPIESVGHFSTGKGFFELQVWRLISFQFLHADHWHLLFNMIGIFFFGPMVESYFKSPRRYLAFYLICGIAGGLLYMLLNVLGEGLGMRLPGVLAGDWYTPLIGASAGVFGILMASAFVAGEATMLVMGIIPMKIRTGAYLLTAFAAYNLITGGSNAGGDAAHLGGAIAGFYFIRKPHLLNEFFDFLGPKIPVGRSKSLSAHEVKNTAPGQPATRKPKKTRDEKQLDRILKKVSDVGLGGLTDKEKAFLNKASEDKR
ncbi:MAG: rhomboid family intramembrane serine protease [Phycisphaerales bacterium]